jgi:hypothetical protein
MCTQLFCWHQEHPALFIRGDAPLPWSSMICLILVYMLLIQNK